MHGSRRRREAISASRASTRRAAGQTSRRPYTNPSPERLFATASWQPEREPSSAKNIKAVGRTALATRSGLGDCDSAQSACWPVRVRRSASAVATGDGRQPRSWVRAKAQLRADRRARGDHDGAARPEIGEKHVATEGHASHLPSCSRGYSKPAAPAWLRVSDMVALSRSQSIRLCGSFGHRAAARSAICSPRAIKSRAGGRHPLRQLEPEAAGASTGRFVAVAGRPL